MSLFWSSKKIPPVLESDLEDIFESALRWAVDSYGNNHITQFTQQITSVTGNFFPDDEIFEAWMRYLGNVYLISQGRIPGKSILEEFVDNLDKHRKEVMDALSFHGPGLYEVLRVNHEKMKVKDLLSKKSIVIFSPPEKSFMGILPGQAVQAVLASADGMFRTIDGILIHPVSCVKIIKYQAFKKFGADGQFSEMLIQNLTKSYVMQKRLKNKESSGIYAKYLTPPPASSHL